MNAPEQPLILAVGQPYPLPYPNGFGAAAQFLSVQGHILQVIIPDMRPEEAQALRQGRMRGGILVEGSAILLLFEFADAQGRPILVFDCPFDIRRVAPENRELPNVDHPNHTRMMIQVHGVDGQGILRSLRGVTLSPDLTCAFLAAVMDQLASAASSQPVIDRGQQLDPQLLLRMTRMTECGR
ncbi:MAG: hypothetical protein RLZZ09_1603 [Pseudomonadota bacterium]|jgi:hypothetical protein